MIKLSQNAQTTYTIWKGAAVAFGFTCLLCAKPKFPEEIIKSGKATIFLLHDEAESCPRLEAVPSKDFTCTPPYDSETFRSLSFHTICHRQAANDLESVHVFCKTIFTKRTFWVTFKFNGFLSVLNKYIFYSMLYHTYPFYCHRVFMRNWRQTLFERPSLRQECNNV